MTFDEFLSENTAPSFGKSWAAHAKVTDPDHHKTQSSLHLGTAVMLGRSGQHKAAAHHDKWANAHKEKHKELQGQTHTPVKSLRDTEMSHPTKYSNSGHRD